MPRYHLIEGKHVQFTAEEEAARDAEEKLFTDNEVSMWLNQLRYKRSAILQESDWMANSDVTMSEEWKSYRQSLRDITNGLTTVDQIKEYLKPDTTSWPEKPKA